jgi:uncharacterized protein (TIRG00374 family)
MNLKLLARLLGPAIFVVILIFFVDTARLKHVWEFLAYPYLGLSLLTVPFIVAVRSFRWQKVLAVFDIDYSVWQCFRYTFVEMIAVALVSSAGPFIKTFYLRRDGAGFGDAVLSIFSDKAFDLLLPLMFGAFSAVSLYFHLDSDKGLLILILLLYALYKPVQRVGVRILPKALSKRFKPHASGEGRIFQLHYRRILTALSYRSYALSIIGFLLYFLSIYFLNLGLGFNFSYSQIVCIMALTSLITAIPISFLGIGTRDAALIAVFSWYGHSVEEAIMLSIGLLLLRLSIMLLGAVFWFMDPPPLAALKQGTAR